MDWFEWTKAHAGCIIAGVIIAIVCFYLGFQYQTTHPSIMETKSELTLLEESSADMAHETIKVYVCGEVSETKVVELPSTARWEDAILAAGGLLETADRNQINLAKPLKNGEKVLVPKKIELIDQTNPATLNKSVSSTLVPINSASRELLMTLPGIGEVKADAIIQYREENGRFEELEDLKKVSGIGEKTFDKLKELIRLD
jgi:competence protein ComEA